MKSIKNDQKNNNNNIGNNEYGINNKNSIYNSNNTNNIYNIYSKIIMNIMKMGL